MVIHIGEAAAAVLVDEVEDAGEDLPVFGITAADPRQPLAIQQLAVAQGTARCPRQQAVGDGHFPGQGNYGEAVGHTTSLCVVLDKLAAHVGEVFQQAGAVVAGEQLLYERRAQMTMVGTHSHGEQAVKVGTL
ncbi:hypothetical protein D9M71_727630 [compost metagenome]